MDDAIWAVILGGLLLVTGYGAVRDREPVTIGASVLLVLALVVTVALD